MLVGRLDFPFQTVGPVLRFYGASRSQAVVHYQKHLQTVLGRGEEGDAIDRLRQSNQSTQSIHEPGCWVIGDSEFVKKALTNDRERRLRIAWYREEGWDLQRLTQHVCTKLGLSTEEILRRGRNNVRSEARQVLAFLGHRVLQVPIVGIAAFLGISPPAVSCMLDRGEKVVRNRPELGLEIS